MDKRKAVKRMLSNLSTSNFADFRHELVHRKKEPRVALNRVEGKSFLEITEVLISTFNETGAVEVSAELLSAIECNIEAAQLLKDAGVEYSEPGSPNSEHFVDKHRTELINRVNCVADILDQLLAKKVITQSSYSEILVIRTTQKQMRELFRGPLNAAGPRGKDIFYGILEKEEKYLIEELKGKK